MTTLETSAPSHAGRRLWSALGGWLSRQTSSAPWLPPRWRHPAIGYLAAVLLQVLITALDLLVFLRYPHLPHQLPFVAGVVIAALNWGVGPSVLATFVGAFLLYDVIFPPHFAWGLATSEAAIGLALFCFVCLMISWFVGQKEQARRQAATFAQEAEVSRQHTERERLRLQQVLDVLPVGVSLADNTGRLLTTNQATKAIWGEAAPLATRVEEYAAFRGWWAATGKPIAPEEWALARAVREGATSLGEEIDIETCAGQRKTILTFAVPLCDAAGVITGGVMAVLDISERKQMEAALRAANAQMDVFLGIASHELQTPLTTLKLHAQLAHRRLERLVSSEGELTEGLAHHLGALQEEEARMVQQLRRLDRLVKDLLDVSRIRAGRLDLRLERVELAALVQEVVEEQRRAAPTRTISLALPAPQVVSLVADADRIGQVVTNYLTNALKYSAAAQPVEVGLEVEGQHARVWVRDHGPGIPVEEQARIWERFHRVPGIEVQSGSGVGLGLGLAICREMIERHQGQVGVDSTPGEGATFWFTLPLVTRASGDQR